MKIMPIISHGFVFLCGGVIFLVSHNICDYARLSRDIAVLTHSHEMTELESATTRLLNRPDRAIIVLQGLTMNIEGKQPTVEARQAMLKSILACPYTLDIPREIIHSTNNPDQTIRTNALDTFETLLQWTNIYGIRFLIKKLESENAPELYDRKLNIICRYLYIDESQLCTTIQKEGLSSIKKELLERLPATSLPMEPINGK